MSLVANALIPGFLCIKLLVQDMRYVFERGGIGNHGLESLDARPMKADVMDGKISNGHFCSRDHGLGSS